MKSTEGSVGRVFILRLEDGDVVPDCIEQFAAENGVSTGYAVLTGGLTSGEVVSGPRDPNARPLQPITVPIENAHEVSAVGVLAPTTDGAPKLHIHGALGRSGSTVTGCLRPGVKTWLVGEVVLYEITGTDAVRVRDEECGFDLLRVGSGTTPAATPQPAVKPQPQEQKQPQPSPEPAYDGPTSSLLFRLNAETN